MKREHLPALTGLRFVAALTIVLYHYARMAWTMPSGRVHGWQVLAFLHNLVIGTGAGGVDLFFVLSGFVLAYTYMTKTGALRTTPQAFWVARIARIYPAYLLAWLLAFVPLVFMQVQGALTAGVLSLFWLQAWYAPAAFVGNGPAYTISIEALFYAVFPFVARPLFYWACTAPRRSFVTLYGALWLPPLIANHFPAGSLEQQAVVISPMSRLPEFLIGFVAGVWFIRQRAAGGAPRQARFWSLSALLLWLGICGLTPVLPHWGVITPETGTLVPLFALLIFSLGWGRGPIGALLAQSWVVLLGEASYALYILQQPIWDALQRAARLPFNAAMQDGAYVLVYVAVLLLVALFVLRTVETPLRQAIRQYASFLLMRTRAITPRRTG